MLFLVILCLRALSVSKYFVCFRVHHVLYVHFLSKCDPSKCKRQSFGFNLSIVDLNAHQTGHKAQHVGSLFELYTHALQDETVKKSYTELGI